jgi:hypothetical protein
MPGAYPLRVTRETRITFPACHKKSDNKRHASDFHQVSGLLNASIRSPIV